MPDFGVLQMFLKQFVPLGFSGNKILKSFRAEGFQIRNETYWDEWRRYQGFWTNTSRIQTLKPTQVPSAWHMFETELKAPHLYRLYAKGYFYDEESGAYFDKTISIYSDERMPTEDWLTWWRDTWEVQKRPESEPQHLQSIELIHIEHFKGKPY